MSMIELTITDNVAEVVLNAPEKMNSLNEAALADLSAAYDEATEAGVRALLLRGEGRGFCAGRDIAGLVPFAHRFGAKVFVTLNTILHDDELEPAQRLMTDLYDAGVDARTVQDMGIMELDLHGKNTYQARVAIDAALRRCGGGVYRLRLIHGYHSGTALRDLVDEVEAALAPPPAADLWARGRRRRVRRGR